jgi:hypothetical protein
VGTRSEKKPNKKEEWKRKKKKKTLLVLVFVSISESYRVFDIVEEIGGKISHL